jgi:hypothetical protein
MHELGQSFNIFNRGLRQNAVAEIENVTSTSLGALQNVLRATLNVAPARK